MANPTLIIAKILRGSPEKAHQFCDAVRKNCRYAPPSNKAIAQSLSRHALAGRDPVELARIMRPTIPTWHPEANRPRHNAEALTGQTNMKAGSTFPKSVAQILGVSRAAADAFCRYVRDSLKTSPPSDQAIANHLQRNPHLIPKAAKLAARFQRPASTVQGAESPIAGPPRPRRTKRPPKCNHPRGVTFCAICRPTKFIKQFGDWETD